MVSILTAKKIRSLKAYENGKKIHLVQSCANECGMVVETLLWADSEIPNARICVKCKGDK